MSERHCHVKALRCFHVLLLQVLAYFVVNHARSELIVFRVREEVSPGSSVGNLREAAPAVFKNTSNTTLLFELSKASRFFAIDRHTSTISTQARIDREAVLVQNDQDSEFVCSRVVAPPGQFAPAALMRCDSSLLVIVRSNFWPQPRFFQVTVELQDVNDHVATWPCATFSLLVPEYAPVGTQFKLPAASDPDFLENGRLDYFLTDSPDLPFKVLTHANRPALVISAAIDCETKSSYSFLLNVRDASSWPRTASILINVTVEDVNDHWPRFVSTISELNVSEGTQQGTVLHRFVATDADSVGSLRYQFDTSATQPATSSVFSLNETSGELILHRRLDRETQAEYQLVVLVSDGQFDVETSLRVVVLDVNDEAPRIDVRPTQPGELAVVENELPGVLIAYVWISDPDLPGTGQDGLHCSLQVGSALALRNWTGPGPRYGLYTAQSFDSEQFRMLLETIICHDGGFPPLTAEKIITVQIKDTNDNAPKIQPASYVSVRENHSTKEPIVTVDATDDDAGLNGVIHYFLNPADVQRWQKYGFKIDRLSGSITARIALDREDVESLTLEVLAVDLGTPQLTSRSVINITVEDLNDVDPEFSSSTYQFSVNENSMKNTVVGHLDVIDRDSTLPNNLIMLHIDGGTKSKSKSTSTAGGKAAEAGYNTDYPFIILPDGKLLLSGELDHEERRQYIFDIVATDCGSTVRSARAAVIVLVDDVNDNYPVWLFPNSTLKSATCSIYDPVATEIARLQASDADTNENGRLSFSLKYGSLISHLAVNAQTGVLYLTKQLESTHVGLHTVVVEVTDSGLGALSNQTTLEILINDLPRPKQTSQSADKGLPTETFLLILLVMLIIMALFVILSVFMFLSQLNRRRRRRTRNAARRAAKEVNAAKARELSANTKDNGMTEGQVTSHVLLGAYDKYEDELQVADTRFFDGCSEDGQVAPVFSYAPPLEPHDCVCSDRTSTWCKLQSDSLKIRSLRRNASPALSSLHRLPDCVSPSHSNLGKACATTDECDDHLKDFEL